MFTEGGIEIPLDTRGNAESFKVLAQVIALLDAHAKTPSTTHKQRFNFANSTVFGNGTSRLISTSTAHTDGKNTKKHKNSDIETVQMVCAHVMFFGFVIVTLTSCFLNRNSNNNVQ